MLCYTYSPGLQIFPLYKTLENGEVRGFVHNRQEANLFIHLRGGNKKPFIHKVQYINTSEYYAAIKRFRKSFCSGVASFQEYTHCCVTNTSERMTLKYQST